MAIIKFEKHVTSLPVILTANTLYFLKNGAGFDLHLTNNTGTIIAYPLNVGSGGGLTIGKARSLISLRV